MIKPIHALFFNKFVLLTRQIEERGGGSKERSYYCSWEYMLGHVDVLHKRRHNKQRDEQTTQTGVNRPKAGVRHVIPLLVFYSMEVATYFHGTTKYLSGSDQTFMEVFVFVVQVNVHIRTFLLPWKYMKTSTSFHRQFGGSCQELLYSLIDSHLLLRVSETTIHFHESPPTSITPTSFHRLDYFHGIGYESKLLLRWKQNTFHGRFFTSEVPYVN